MNDSIADREGKSGVASFISRMNLVGVLTVFEVLCKVLSYIGNGVSRCLEQTRLEVDRIDWIFINIVIPCNLWSSSECDVSKV